MCEVIDRIENCGIQKGIDKGIDKGRKQINLLMKKLFTQKRFEDAQKATEDTQYCTQLLQEFAIV